MTAFVYIRIKVLGCSGLLFHRSGALPASIRLRFDVTKTPLDYKNGGGLPGGVRFPSRCEVHRGWRLQADVQPLSI